MTSLEEHVRVAASAAQAVRAQSGTDFVPMLHLGMPDGSIRLAVLQVEGGGPAIARAARGVLLQARPQLAIVIVEGWTARPGLSQDDPDHRAVLAGRLRPSQLPPHKRGERLTLYGETASGEEAWQIIDITAGAYRDVAASWDPEVRVAAERGEPGFASRFRPLFMVEHMLRSIPPLERAELEQLLGGQAIEAVLRKQALQLIARGGGATHESFNRESNALQEQTRRRIGWRGE
jgi:hypothetical protein